LRNFFLAAAKKRKKKRGENSKFLRVGLKGERRRSLKAAEGGKNYNTIESFQSNFSPEEKRREKAGSQEEEKEKSKLCFI
jgi:hypothetical protein